MRVIGLAVILTVSLILAPPAAEGQQAEKVARIGFLSPSSLSDPRTQTFVEAFRQGLRDRGWIPGQNVTIEYLGRGKDRASP
jgi:putative ABC transport system substrate-binding protein